MVKIAAAFGGKKLAGIKGYQSYMSLDMEIQGMALTPGIEKTIVYPDKAKMVQKTPFSDRVQCLDGESGWVQGPMGVQDMDAIQIATMKDEITGSMITLLMDPSAFTCHALGQEELDGLLCDRVNVQTDNGDFTLYYVDAATHLIVMEQGKGEDPISGSAIQQKIKYADYKDFGGFKRPGTLTILHDDEHFATGEMKKFVVNPQVTADYFRKPR